MSLIQERELACVENILNNVDVTANMERLYLSLIPLFRKEINRYGREQDYDDLMQEMYFAVVDSVEAYKDPATRENYPFFSIVANKIKDKISSYLFKFYHKYVDEDGKQRAYKTQHNACSLNAKLKNTEEKLELLELLQSDTNIEEEVIARETAEEQKQAAAVLWSEVDKLSPLLRESIVDYYKHGIGHAEKAEKTGENRKNITCRVSKGLKKLRNNPNVQEAAKAYLPSVAYHGGVRSFKNTGMSSTERAALQNIEKEERAKISMRSNYKLINSAFFEGKNIKALARCIGIGASTIRQLHHGKSVTRSSTEKIARFYGKPFDELFVIDIERAAPKGDPNNNYKVKKNIPKYILADSSSLDDYTRSHLNRDKLQELNTSVDTVEKIILKLRRGGRSLRETAERVAYVLDREFGEMFVRELIS